jgi:hypothetical protein
MSLSQLKRTIKTKKNNSQTNKIVTVKKAPKPYVKNLFIKAQLDWINDKSPFCVFSKGRRIGISFCESLRATRDALLGIDTIYTSYNLNATKKFISNCGKWAKALNHVFRVSKNIEIIDERNILNYVIHFPNGAMIQAVSSNPENLRDREGVIVLDEFAFRDNQEELIKAANAITMRGGQVRVISTHNGEDNYFNTLCKEIRKGERLGSLHHCPFMLAVDQGMYKSMMAVKGQEWTEEKENNWVENIYGLYKGFSEEELDAIPRKLKGNRIFIPEWFEYVDISEREILAYSISVAYFDLASTDLEKAKENSFYSAYVQLVVVENLIIVYDCGVVQLDGSKGNEWRKQVIKGLKYNCVPYFEIEPGSGDLLISYAREEILKDTGIEIQGYKPIKSKMMRALPLLPYIKNRSEEEFRLVIHERLRDYMIVNNITQEEKNFVDWICRFDATDNPLTNDLTDCLSGAFDVLYRETLSTL